MHNYHVASGYALDVDVDVDKRNKCKCTLNYVIHKEEQTAFAADLMRYHTCTVHCGLRSFS